MNPSSSQIQALLEGKEKEAIKYLNKHHAIAIIIFVLAIVTAGLWGEVIIKLSTKIYGVKAEDLELWQMTLTATIFTMVSYILIIYVIKLPITVAFSL
jgi:uncharacterized BrkB/YihY/UPF0761 family membrane protein